MKKVVVNSFFGILCTVIIITEFIILLNVPGMQKGFVLKFSPAQVTAQKVQSESLLWKAGLRDGDKIENINGFSFVKLQSLNNIKALTGNIPEANNLFTTKNGITVQLSNGKQFSVPYEKQSFITEFKTVPTVAFFCYCFALLLLAFGFFQCYFVYEYNLNKDKNTHKKYIFSTMCYLIAIVVANYRLPFCSNSLYTNIVSVLFDTGVLVFCLMVLYLNSKLHAKKIAIQIKSCISIIICIAFFVKYLLLLQGFISFNTYPYYLFYIFSFILTGAYFITMYLHCLIKSGVLYSETGCWIPLNTMGKVDFDAFEQNMLKKQTRDQIFDYANEWILTIFDACCSGYIEFDSDEQPVIKSYNEKIKSKNIFLQMLEERVAKKDSTDLLKHTCKGFSVPIVEESEILGFLFIGPSKQAYTDEQIYIVRPLVRILTKALLNTENEKNEKEKNQLQSAFSKYVSPEIVHDILLNPDLINLGGQKKILSVIFTDLQGFTTFSDDMDPSQLVRVLNSYLTEMSEVIIALGGTIDKYEGDAILAFFGAPSSLKEHAERCCRAALGMKHMEKIINDQLIDEGLIKEPLYTRMGINTGEMVVGNIGSVKRLDYTIIGSNVNIASRIEDINKQYKTQILISEQTYNIVKDKFVTRKVDTVQLKGIHNPITLYELIEEQSMHAILNPTISESEDSLDIPTLEEI